MYINYLFQFQADVESVHSSLVQEVRTDKIKYLEEEKLKRYLLARKDSSFLRCINVKQNIFEQMQEKRTYSELLFEFKDFENKCNIKIERGLRWGKLNSRKGSEGHLKIVCNNKGCSLIIKLLLFSRGDGQCINLYAIKEADAVLEPHERQNTYKKGLHRLKLCKLVERVGISNAYYEMLGRHGSGCDSEDSSLIASKNCLKKMIKESNAEQASDSDKITKLAS